MQAPGTESLTSLYDAVLIAIIRALRVWRFFLPE